MATCPFSRSSPTVIGLTAPSGYITIDCEGGVCDVEHEVDVEVEVEVEASVYRNSEQSEMGYILGPILKLRYTVTKSLVTYNIFESCLRRGAIITDGQ
jgi:hypothetical protein